MGGLPKERAEKTILLADACPRNECIFYSRALNMPVKSQDRITSHLFSPSGFPVCFLSLLLFPLLPSTFLLTQSKMIDKLEASGGRILLSFSPFTGLRQDCHSDPTEKIQIMFMPHLRITTPSTYPLFKKRLRAQGHQSRSSML